MKKLAAFICMLWVMPVVVPYLPGSVDLGGQGIAAEKKKTRRVPAMRESTYKRLAEAQVMIDPESTPREEGEPAPVPKGRRASGIRKLQRLTPARPRQTPFAW